MKSIATAAAALMLLATPIVTADSADAGHRHRSWVQQHYHDYGWHPHHRKHHRKIVRKRHHRWVNRGGIVIKIIVLPGAPAYYGCGYCW